MSGLIAAAALFLAIHLCISGTRLRDIITARIGEKPYLGAFALASLAAIVWLCRAYGSASGANTVLFDAGAGFRIAVIPAMLAAFLLAVPGVLRTNPTSQGQERAPIGGVLRITRHPFLWGVLLWSGFHLIAAGTQAGAVFFGTFFLTAALGIGAIDGKVKRKRPGDWAAISAKTSALPFAAIFARKTRFSAKEYFDWRFFAALAVFAGFLIFHARIFSVPAFTMG
jgi:Predicted membrane protein